MKNFVSMSMDTYSKDRMNKINEHNKNRMNNDKKISYLLDKKLDDNVHYTLRKIEDLEAKRLSYLSKNNKEDKQKKHIVEMVVALSYDKVKEYLDNGKTTKDIDKGFYQYAKNLEDKYGFKTMEISIHKDEGHIKENGEIQYNYHSHLVFHNFNFDTGKPIASYLRRQDYRDMQTLAQESFNEVGLEFFRGNDKRDTFAKHLKRNEFIQKVKKEELKGIFVNIDKAKEVLKKVYQDLNLEKNKVKEQRNQYEKDSLEYKNLNDEYKELQQKEKEAREEYRNIEEKLNNSKVEIKNKDDYEKTIKNEILGIFETHTKLEKPIIGANFYKVENRKDFFNKVLTKVKEPLNAQLNEIEHLKRENANLNTTLENLNTTLKNSVPKKDYIDAAKAFEIKNKQNLELVKKNKELNEFIKEKGLDIQDIENNNINNDMER